MVSLHVTETTPIISTAFPLEAGGSWVSHSGHGQDLKPNTVLPGPSQLNQQRPCFLQVELVDGVVFVRLFVVPTPPSTSSFPLPIYPL
uniref:Uncharacterized protein n=1 Tax=Anguilla anguilla TaxID=7936 RepID=A0A0E9Q9N5_ANGAN